MAFTRDDYYIGWIATLDIELAVAKAMLEKPYHPKLPKAAKDTNTYTLGRIGEHNVVIAGLPSGSIGTTSAALAASNLVRSYPKVRFVLMVGIGEGISMASLPPMKDVRLGDIVVSSPNGFHGGVVQFDHGTATTSGFRRKGTLNKPPVAVRTALQDLRSEALMEGYKFETYYKEMLQNYPSMAEKYERPNLDRLYKTQCAHVGPDCSECPEDMLETRPARKSSEPAVHYGTIGSANRVVRDSVLRDKLYNEEGVICFDLASAGLMDGFECLIIRGIADYCDDHKNEEWQPYAAAIAAAFAKEFLLTIQPEEVDGMPHVTILESIQDGIEKICEQNEQFHNFQAIQLHQNIIRWLAAPDPEPDLQAAWNLKSPSTGAWLMNSKAYLAWKNGSKRHLWLFGKAGCGKSVMSAAIIHDIREYCRDHQDTVCGMFYFTFSDKQKQSYRDCLRSLIMQLAIREEALSRIVSSHDLSRGSPETSRLEEILLAAIRSYDRVFVVLDGLDESPEETDGHQTVRQGLLKQLLRMSKVIPKLSLLITSRDLVDIRRTMSHLKAAEVPMTANYVDQDIMQFTRWQLAHDPDLIKFGAMSKREIEVTMAKSDGMFLWAYYLIQELKGLPIKDLLHVKEVLQRSPTNLDCVYDRMFSKVSGHFRDEALYILRWLATRKRTTNLKDLVESLKVTIDGDTGGSDLSTMNVEEMLNLLGGFIITSRSTDNHAFSKTMTEDSKHTAVSGLVSVKKQSKKKHTIAGDLKLDEYTQFKLVHFSARKYMKSQRILNSSSKDFYFETGLGGNGVVSALITRKLLRGTCALADMVSDIMDDKYAMVEDGPLRLAT